jgi:DNA-directed RNA polymerase specialized sigma24 family protein
MQSDSINPILGFMRHLAAAGEVGRLTDGQLLERFVKARDEAAFETLLHRHGAMVLRVCRRALRESHAAEDAFQATFLVFVRKAASIRKPELLGNWLYGVAYRVACRARKTISLRTSRERADVATLAAPAAD